MRSFLLALPLCLCCLLSSSNSGVAQTVGPGVQSLLLGDRTCGDTPTDCAFPNTTAIHRFLHVILHDRPGDRNWAVWVGSDCAGTVQEAQGAIPIGASGFEEVVIDLAPPARQVRWEGVPLCYLLRGGYGQTSTYYAAYFDDSASPDGDVIYPGYEALAGRPDFADLDVTYIHRAPSLAYDAPQNTPRTGQSVTFVAHVLNAGGLPLQPFQYVWILDGRPVRSGISPAALPANGEMTFQLSWHWSPAPHTLTFGAAPADSQLSTANDSLTVRTDAITLGFWVERSAYDYFRDHQWSYCRSEGCDGSDSFEDWLQRQVRTWNRLFRTSTYPGLSPQGIVTRVRLDRISVVPDGALPLHGGIATDTPDRSDHITDLQWGLPAASVEATYPLDRSTGFRIDWALLHELGHARSLADLYRFDIPVSSPSEIAVHAADGRLAYNTAAPFDLSNRIRAFYGSDGGTLLYQNAERDLMSCVCSDFYSPYSALVLNRLANRRAVCGNANPPCNIGDWFADIPRVNLIRIVTRGGRPLATGSTVRIFYDTGPGYTTHRFTDAQSTALRVSNGEVMLPADPFQAGSSAERGGHNLLLLEISAPGLDEFCFQEPTDFNMTYWEGYADAQHPAVYTLQLGGEIQNGCHLTLPPARVNEPFATSAQRSSVHVGRPIAGHRPVDLQLVDAAGLPMTARECVVRDLQGRVLGVGTTDSQGRLSLRIPGGGQEVVVEDVTDNHLLLSSG